MTKKCLNCKYYDDLFTCKCDNPESVHYGEVQDIMGGCKCWKHYSQAWNEDREDTAPEEEAAWQST